MKAANCIVTIMSSTGNRPFDLPVLARTPGYVWYRTPVGTSDPHQVVRALEGAQLLFGDDFPDEEMWVTVQHPPHRHEYGGSHHVTRKGVEAVLNKNYA